MVSDVVQLKARMEEALAKGKEWMRNVRIELKEAGKIVCGWGERDKSTSIDPWGGTADGILCLLKGKPGKEDLQVVEKAIGWFYGHQEDTGGFSSEIPPIKHPITQCTAWVLMALVEYAEKVLAPETREDVGQELLRSVRLAIEWLKDNQNDDGGWGLWKDEEHGSRVYPTAVAVRALIRAFKLLRRIGYDPSFLLDLKKRIKRGVKWLLDARGLRGAWGFVPRAHEVYPAHTAHAFITLYEWYELTEELSSRGFKLMSDEVRTFLLEMISDEHLWAPCTELISDIKDPIAGGGRGIGTTHFSTPWCIMALCLLGLSIFDEPILSAVESLLSLQDEKTGAFFFSQDARETGDRRIWATHDAVTALDFLLRRLSDPDSLLRELNILMKRAQDLEEHFRTCSAFVQNIEDTIITHGRKVFLLTCGLILVPLAVILLYLWLAPLSFWIPVFLTLTALLPYCKIVEGLASRLIKGPEDLAKIRKRAQELTEERKRLLRARGLSKERR